jgi:hypothetical protein
MELVIRKNERVAFRELASGEGAVLLHLETGQYHGLNRIGSAIWTLIDGERTRSDVVAELSKRVSEPPDKLEDDVELFLDDMRARDLIAF